ncbi:MAG: cytochrome P450 [Gammaproteobacteria bacterium]|nr:cytochrome P450 [Gammaproteobacteria bacterium]
MNKTIPMPPYKGFLGHLPQVKQDFYAFMTQCFEQYGDIVHIKLGMKDLILLSHPSLIEDILVKQQDVFIKAYEPDNPRGLALLLGQGLLTSRGGFWKKQRRTIQPMFHRQSIGQMYPSMLKATREMMSQWEGFDSDAVVDINEEMTKITLEIITQCMFSSSVKQTVPQLRQDMETALTYCQKQFFNPLALPLWVPTRTNRKFNQVLKRLRSIIASFIYQRRMQIDKQGDLLDLLINARDPETGKFMSERAIIDEAITFFSAGHETTAHALSWTWYLLSQHPEAMQKLQQEVDSVLTDRLPRIEDIEKLVYTRAVFEETIRLYPPAVVLLRKVSQATSLNGYEIPKGAFVIGNIRNVQHHPAVWPQAESFKPERFLGDQRNTIQRYAHIPFGAGPRACIGSAMAMMEGPLIIAMIAQRFDVQLAADAKVEEKLAITLRPKNGLPMVLRKRSNNLNKQEEKTTVEMSVD